MKKITLSLLLLCFFALVGCWTNQQNQNKENLTLRPYNEIISSQQEDILSYLNQIFSIQGETTKTEDWKLRIEANHPRFWKIELFYVGQNEQNKEDIQNKSDLGIEIKLSNLSELDLWELSDLFVKLKVDFDVIIKDKITYFKLNKINLDGDKKALEEAKQLKTLIDKFQKNVWFESTPEDSRPFLPMLSGEMFTQNKKIQNVILKHVDLSFLESDWKLVEENWRKFYRVSVNKEKFFGKIYDLSKDLSAVLPYNSIDIMQDREEALAHMKENLDLSNFKGEIYLNSKQQEEISLKGEIVSKDKKKSLDINVVWNKDELKLWLTSKEENEIKWTFSFEKVKENFKGQFKAEDNFVAKFDWTTSNEIGADKSLKGKTKININLEKVSDFPEKLQWLNLIIDSENNSKVQDVKIEKPNKIKWKLQDEMKRIEDELYSQYAHNVEHQ